MSLPAIDLGLMAEHLTAHEGVINKLELYQTKVSIASLKEIIVSQTNMMRDHVRVMLALINPYQQNEYVELSPINEHSGFNKQPIGEHNTNFQDKWIALDGHNTAKNMSNNNYVSALMMQDPYVRNIHIQMALQQFEMLDKYNELITKMGWTFTPHATVHEQFNTFQYYEHILHQ